MGNYESGAPKDSGGNPIPVTWTDDPLQQDITETKKQHLVEMRAALQRSEERRVGKECRL